MTREEWQMQMLILTHEESDAEHFNAALHTLEAWDIAQRMKIEHQAKEIQALQAQLANQRRYQELVNYIVEHDDGDFSQEIRDEAEQYGLENIIKLKA